MFEKRFLKKIAGDSSMTFGDRDSRNFMGSKTFLSGPSHQGSLDNKS